ncbi:hypothetical protein H310_07785 [Aphanomyces invadans]|uniref:WRKY19-like zinc finger domain-containing protein n=1 Tax=Aphanomyces invadans TaxID=157072 RepID=A0A024U1E9_9STRA|nr:hypothetical protein H310_07785 [Aphanomyces invadans]ETV99726.1 hypothetical protein H310_07785 [Aphanomyces invadans]|eukprot:XP_008871502.1 hypothetical protein H310_07785 [Aphanomyces invadans]
MPPTARCCAKFSIGYLMNTDVRPLTILDLCHDDDAAGTLHSPTAFAASKMPSMSPSGSVRHCEVVGCENVIASRKRCISHGGGARCKVPTCPNGAKRNGVCWTHGGSRLCTMDGCMNQAKARGLCWSHGGGKPCQTPQCSKTALRYGHCWAHGGGKRCLEPGCNRPGFERHGNFCQQHFEAKRPSYWVQV